MNNKKTKQILAKDSFFFRIHTRNLLAACLVFVSMLTTTEARAQSYTFTWSANPEPVEGYKLYYKKGGAAAQPFAGTDALEGTSPINVGKATTYTITGLDKDSTYHFALTAVSGSDESSFSTIISVDPAPKLLNIKLKQ